MKLYKHKKLGKLLVVDESTARRLHAGNILAKPLGEDQEEAEHWVVRHNKATLAALDKLGIERPDLSEGYDWPAKFDLYSHQKTTAEYMASHDRAWCTNGMRSGKTTSAGSGSDLARSCKDLGADARVLILCPVNVMTTAWYREMLAIDRRKTYYVAKSSTAAVRKQLKDKDINTLILNHDKLEWLSREIDEWLGRDGLVIVDEAHAFRNPKTKRFKNLKYLVDPAHEDSKHRKLWLFTGTPVPNAPTDIYHLQKLIDASRVPASEGEWRGMTMKSYQITVPARPGSTHMRPITKWSTLACAEQMIADAMHPCIRFRTQDCVELPEQAYSYYDCELSKDQKRMIKEMVAGYATTHEDKALVAANAGVRVSKILQVCTGAVLDNEGNGIEVGAPSKIKCLLDLMEQNEGKTIVFCTYKASQKYIKKMLNDKKITAEIVNGDTTPTKKVAIADKFQSRRTPEVLILHPQCEGMTLSAALLSVWFGPPDSNLQWSQANERMRAPVKGTDKYDDKHKTLVAMLTGSSLEKQRYVDRIESDEKQTRAIDIYAEALKEFGTAEALKSLFTEEEA